MSRTDAAAATRRIAWTSSGSPARSRSALGAPEPRRRPAPAAGTRTATSPRALSCAVTSRSCRKVVSGMVSRSGSGLGEDLVEENLGLVLRALLRESHLADQDVAGLGEHALLSCGETALALATPEVTHDLGDLERVTGGELLEVRLVTPRPVGRLLGVRSAEDVEDLAQAFLADHFANADDLGVLSRHPDGQITLGDT